MTKIVSRILISLTNTLLLSFVVLTALAGSTPSSEVINKKVYILVYDPILSNSQKLSAYKGWNSYTNLTNELIAFFKGVTARFSRRYPRAINTFTNWLAGWRWGQANIPDSVGPSDATAGQNRRAGQSGGKPNRVSQSSVPRSMPASS